MMAFMKLVLLRERAVGIYWVECILLQEDFPDHTGNFKQELLFVWQSVGTDKLHDFLQFGFYLQHFHCSFPHSARKSGATLSVNQASRLSLYRL